MYKYCYSNKGAIYAKGLWISFNHTKHFKYFVNSWIDPPSCLKQSNKIEYTYVSLAFKHEYVKPKHALTGCQMRHDWSLNIVNLADHVTNICTQNLAHEMAERLDIKDFCREIDPDLCQYCKCSN